MEEQYTEGCSEESCAGCSHSGSCESQKQNAGNTAPSKAPANVGSQVKKSDWSHQRKGWRWKIAGNSFPGTYDDRKRIYGRNFGCRYYRSIHSEDVRSARDGNRKRDGNASVQRTGWNKDHVRQPAFGRGGHTGHLERSCDRRRCDDSSGQMVMWEIGLSVR